jgi:hypothetical protein
VSPLVIGAPVAPTVSLCEALGAPLVPAPALPPADGWSWSWSSAVDAWADELRALPRTDQVVVCTWSAPAAPAPFAEVGTERWMATVEQPLALWFAAAVAAADRCQDGGSLVLVVERPAAIDAAGFSDVVTVAEGLVNLGRSLGHSEGARGVRVNVVTSQLVTVPEVLVGLPPMVAGFPGAAEREIAGAVRLLLSADAAGISGTAVRADGGRAW